jgi:hypothetical protein
MQNLLFRIFLLSFLTLALLSCKQKKEIQSLVRKTTLPPAPKNIESLYASKHLKRDPNTNLLKHLSDESVATKFFYHNKDGKPGSLFNSMESSEKDGTDGCFELVNSYQSYEFYKEDKWDALDLSINHAINVQSNTVYTFSIMMKTPQVCPSPSLEMKVVYFNQHGENIATRDVRGNVVMYNGKPLRKIETIRALNSKANVWQEQNLVFTTPKNTSKITFGFVNNLEYEIEDELVKCKDCGCPLSNKDCWPILIDDFFLGEGISFSTPPTINQSFKNEYTRIDHLGNIEVMKDGRWSAFFPLMIFQDYKRHGARHPGNPYHGIFLNKFNDASDDGYRLYTQMGFNTAAWTRTAEDIQALLNAGIDYVNFDITGYCKEWDNKGSYLISRFITDLQEIKNAGLEDKILFFYHDNELSLHQEEWKDLLDVVREYSNQPIFQLNGYPGNTANYNNDNCDLVDVVGTYVCSPRDGYTNTRISILDHQSNMNVPAIVGQHTQLSPNPKSGGHGINPRSIIYASIASGARSYGYFMDVPYRDIDGDGKLEYDKTGDIRFAKWKDDFPVIACEVNNMLPIIRMPHWTPWKVKSNNKKIDIGTREFEGYPYLFLANSSGSVQSLRLDLSELEIGNTQVTDYNYKTSRGQVRNNIYNTKLKKDEGVLLRINKPIPNHLRFKKEALPYRLEGHTSCSPGSG